MRLLFAMLSVMLAFALGVFAEHDFNVVNLATDKVPSAKVVGHSCTSNNYPVSCGVLPACQCENNCTCCNACPGKGSKGACTCKKCDCCKDCPGHYKQKQK